MIYLSLFISLPVLCLSLIIKHLNMAQLLGLDIGKVIVQFHLPFGEDFSLLEFLEQAIDPLISICRGVDSVLMKISHFFGILCKVFW
jgi:hypothetical protein